MMLLFFFIVYCLPWNEMNLIYLKNIEQLWKRKPETQPFTSI
jgi:hypothetical protein